MGVGVSAHRLAGAVAREDCVGTISSVDLRRHHPRPDARDRPLARRQAIERANLTALDREIRAAREIAGGRGIIAVNVMRAVSQYAGYVRQSCASGADAIVVGAGLPFDLPELTADYPDVALIPILSEARAIGLVLKKWQRKGRLPDAIVIEHPRYAGGHLGAAKIDDVGDARFDFAAVLPAAQRLFEEMGIAPIPLIVAGGINTPEKRARGAVAGRRRRAGRHAVRGDRGGRRAPEFQARARRGAARGHRHLHERGGPARARGAHALAGALPRHGSGAAGRAKLRRHCTLAFECLAQCGLRDGNARMGQFCIDHHLAAALRGDVDHGLFFRGSESVPFGGEIRPVRELTEHLLGAPVCWQFFFGRFSETK